MVIFPPWNAAWAWLRPLPATVSAQVDQSIEHGLDGVIVYVAGPGTAGASYAAGWKTRDDKVPADADALFRIASISKLYIASAVAKMAGTGMLSLDATLADHLPELTERIAAHDRITVRMLVQHRSGIPDYVRAKGFEWGADLSYGQKLDLVLDRPPEFAPGTDYAYSNTNYLLLGRILDDVLGYPHQTYIGDELLVPLGLSNTFHFLDDADRERVAGGYHYEIKDNLVSLAMNAPGGSMVATAEDVGVFLRALGDGSLLGDAQSIYTSIYELEHTGWIPGYQSSAAYFPDTGTVVVLFVSSTGGETEIVTAVVFDRILRILKRQERSEQATAGRSGTERRRQVRVRVPGQFGADPGV